MPASSVADILGRPRHLHPRLARPSSAARHAPSLDERILRLLRTRGHPPAAERAVAAFSALGEHGALWLAIGASGAAIDRGRSARWLAGAGTVLTAYASNTALKLLVRRRRPTLADLPPLASTPTQLSFPSAHTATAFAGAYAYSRLGLPAPALGALACATGISRLYLGLHYPSDVIAGALLGHAIAVTADRSRRERQTACAEGSATASAGAAAGASLRAEEIVTAWEQGPASSPGSGANGSGAGSDRR